MNRRFDDTNRRVDAQAERINTVVAAREKDRERIEGLGEAVDGLTLEMTKLRITMDLMIKAFNGAKMAAYGVIGTVVAAALIIVLGLR